MRKILMTLAVVGMLAAITGSTWADGRHHGDRYRGDWDRDRSRFSVGVRYYAPVYSPYVWSRPVYVIQPAPVYVEPAPVYVTPAPVVVAPTYQPVYPPGTYPGMYAQPVPVQRGVFGPLSVFSFRFSW